MILSYKNGKEYDLEYDDKAHLIKWRESKCRQSHEWLTAVSLKT